MSSNHYNYPPPGGAPNANSPNPLRPYYSASDSPLQSYYNTTLTSTTLEEELAAQNEINSQTAAKELLSYGFVKYMTLAIAAPFEAGQTLLQVQYLPNDDGFNGDEQDLAEQVSLQGRGRKSWKAELCFPLFEWIYLCLTCIVLLFPNQAQRDAVQRRAQEIETERERDFYNDRTGSTLHQTSVTSGYYTSQYGNLPSNSSSSSSRDAYGSPRDSGLISRYNEPSRYEAPSLAPTDPTVTRSSVYDEGSRPAYQMAPIEGGVWKAVTDLAKHPTEGWMSLWKGN